MIVTACLEFADGRMTCAGALSAARLDCESGTGARGREERDDEGGLGRGCCGGAPWPLGRHGVGFLSADPRCEGVAMAVKVSEAARLAACLRR